MKQKTLFLLLFFPFFVTTLEFDYRPALKATIEDEDIIGVRTMLDCVPPETVPEVIPKSDHFVDAWTSNPIFLDTNPTILEMLKSAGVSISHFDKTGTFRHFPVEEHTRYENIAWLLSHNSDFSPWHSLKHALEKEKDPRIIFAFLLSEAQPKYQHRGMQFMGDHPISINCFSLLQKQIKEHDQKEKTPLKEAKAYWIAMAIAERKKDGWKKILFDMINLYPETIPSTENSALLLRKRRRGKRVTEDQLLAVAQKAFKAPYNAAFEQWCKTGNLASALEKLP